MNSWPSSLTQGEPGAGKNSENSTNKMCMQLSLGWENLHQNPGLQIQARPGTWILLSTNPLLPNPQHVVQVASPGLGGGRPLQANANV